MKAIAIFTLVICCIGVESLPGVRAKRETKDCSSLVVPRQKIYQIFHKRDNENTNSISTWKGARVACQDLGGDLAVPSTREEENKILAAINKAVEGGTLPNYWQFWIGLEQIYSKYLGGGEWETYPQWVSGEKIDPQDTDLKLSRAPFNTDWYDGGCGTIEGGGNDREGIRFLWGESEYGIQGYVCEFDIHLALLSLSSLKDPAESVLEPNAE